MEYVIHLTNKCNLRCKYCYQTRQNMDISFEHIKNLIDYEISRKDKYCVINFYGGEPLLKKDMIIDTIEYVKSKKTNTDFYYAMTTNGTLLDDEFIKYMKENNFINVTYSFDGTKETHDLNRLTADGKGTFDIVLENAKKLINTLDSVVVNVVITKNNLQDLSKNVEFLIGVGFKKINFQFNYLYDWQVEDLPEIKKQYSKVAELYAEKIMNEENIDIAMIDEKIKSYVNKGFNCNKECKLGIKTINVGTDGNFYPCVQFVDDENFIIGNCKDGINFYARQNLIKSAYKENEICKKCAINKRCKHTCACKNYILTKDINELSPVVCETEKIIIDVADKMAEKLYKHDSKLFIQKYYNKDFDYLISLINKKEK